MGEAGPTGQFTDTYNTMRGHLLDKGTPYPLADVEVLLQGSYGNTTNVYADSDVDIVLKHDGTYYDISGLPEEQQASFESGISGAAQYGYTQFKADAEGYIKRLYNGVQVGKKPLRPGNNGRRNADILICQEFRRYTSYEPGNILYRGAVAHSFWAASASIISRSNIPRTAPRSIRQRTGNFKSMVRIFKHAQHHDREQPPRRRRGA